MVPVERRHLFLASPGLPRAEKIKQIVREEQDRSGAMEMLMPTVQPADIWRESKRYDAYGPEMLRFNDRHDSEMLDGPNNEELITQLFRDGVIVSRPAAQPLPHPWKFRDEVRPRFGVMRGREFLMKDAFLRLDGGAARHAYNKMFIAYLRTFARMGLKSIPMAADTGRSAAISATSSSSWRRPGKAGSTATPTSSRPRAGRRRRLRADLPRSSSRGRRPTRQPTRSTMRPLRSRSAGGEASLRPRHRGRPHFLLRHQVFRTHGVPGAGAGREHDRGADGLLRSWCLAAGRRHRRGEPRRARHRLAGAGCALRGRSREPQGGRHR